MAFDPITAAISAAPSVAQLLIGENSLFSGKARQASREMKKTFDLSQAAGINKGYYDVLGQQAGRANQGMGGASLGLARMEQGRAMAAQLGALGGRRSALAGLPGLGISSSDFALRLAASNEMAQRQNQAAYEGTQLQVAGLEDQNAQRKRDEAMAYWGNRKAESDASISSSVQGIGQAIGAGIQAGQFDKQMSVLEKTGGGGGSRAWGNVLGSKDSWGKALLKKGADTLVTNAATSLGQQAPNFLLPQYNRMSTPSANKLMGNPYGLGPKNSSGLLMRPTYGG
jgi:hypothetical protein